MANPGTIQAALARSPHFSGLPAESLARLAAIARVKRYGDEELVHAPGMARPFFLIVLAGSLRVSYPSGHGAAVTLAMLEPGSFHNVTVAMGAADPHCELHSFGASEVAAIGRGALREAADADPALDAHLKSLALARVYAVVGLFCDITAAPLERRLARRLMAQSMSHRGPVELHGTQAHLAQMLRAGRTLVSAKLKDWERRGLLRVGYRTLLLRDVPAISRIAGAGVRRF
jgi:CRP/FNR family transcriptional regulator, cyclic AMP receptor protein